MYWMSFLLYVSVWSSLRREGHKICSLLRFYIAIRSPNWRQNGFLFGW